MIDLDAAIRKEKAPARIAYHLREGFYHRIGEAWEHLDGSFSIHLDCVPRDGWIRLRVANKNR